MTAVASRGGVRRSPVVEVSAVPLEGRPYQGRRAGIVSRLVANTVDFLVLVLVEAAGYAAVCATLFLWSPSSFSWPDFRGLVLLAVGAAVIFVYLTLSWATTGRSYGDHLLGLRVVNFRGNRMTWPGAAARAAFYVVFPIGIMWVAVSRQNRSVQDVVLRTSVIYDWGPGHVSGTDARITPVG